MKQQLYKNRINYSDTDCTGVVYHARYLNLLDKARVEFLRAFGVDVKTLKDEQQLCFIVSNLTINYIKPAKLEDEVFVYSEIKEVKNITLIFSQHIKLNDENSDIICKAEIKLGCVNSNTFRPSKIPQVLKEKWS